MTAVEKFVGQAFSLSGSLRNAGSDDRKRGRKADVPDEMMCRSRWRSALEQLDRAAANGVTFDALTLDESHGGKSGFPRGLDDLTLAQTYCNDPVRRDAVFRPEVKYGDGIGCDTHRPSCCCATQKPNSASGPPAHRREEQDPPLFAGV